MNEPVKKRWASALFNGDFYLLETYSGYGMSRRDPVGKQHFLLQSVDAEKLGEALLDALAHSRFLSLAELDDFFDYAKTKQSYAEWVDALVKRYAYKSKRALFKNMACCSVTVVDDNLEIIPNRHEKLEMWVGAQNEGVENVVIPAKSSPIDVGEALRMAFSRCT